MRKLRALIAFFMVILIQITPWSLGLRPAHAIWPLIPAVAAALAEVEVGTVISAGLVTGSIIYAQGSTYNALDTSIDPVSGNIARAVYQAKEFGVGAQKAFYGVPAKVELGFNKVLDWVQAHPLDFPLLQSAFNAASSPAPFTPLPYDAIVAAQSGFPWSVNPGTYISGAYGGGSLATDAACQAQFQGWGLISSSGIKILYDANGRPTHMNLNARKGPSWCLLDQQQLTNPVRQTSNVAVDYPPPAVISPSGFASGFAHSPETQAEIDKMIFGNPAAVIAKPVSFLPWQVSAAHAQAVAKAAQTTAVAAESASAANPADIPLQIAASQARAAADQAEIAVQGELAKSEAVEIEKAAEAEKEAAADIPYSPSTLAGPYTLPTVDFGARLQQFIDSAKSSSIFSLPGSVFGNVPGAGISTMTINGGQIFGTHVFDFADMFGMWVVLRGIILTGFSFIAVRVVTLKR
ncbi:MAG: hypothetical protein A2511_14845 [Deltaproteobacteria bacterium RIFOXYD12_FULL_50_9]|nr:MAG: hypothetical protein A2511_14845 [Deltaproteobacteria bacterium RIFOXYD12_FULL_50_9]